MAKSKKESVDKESNLQSIIDQLNKDYGEGTVMSFSDKSTGVYDIIPTGSISFDEALGIGGYARGRLYELRGWEGTGKTTICGEAVAQCQALGLGKVLYIDGEHALDKDYFSKLGVNVDDMLISQPSNGEEGFTIANSLIESGEIALVIIDSDSSLIPKKVLEGEIGDANIGKKAKLNSDAYPKLKGLIEKYNTCCIVISQYREKIGVMFGDPRTTQGGHALKFYADGIIELTKSHQKEGDQIVATKVTIKISKNKMAPPFKKGDVEILFGYGFNAEKEVYELAQDHALIKKWGKRITYGEQVFEMEENAFLEMLRDNEELYVEIKNKVLAKLKE